jgi:hypothetical protein
VGCDDNAQCANKPFSAQGPLCNTVTGNCVSCITNAECTDPTASLCGNGGTCAICNDNDDCDLFNGQDGRPLARACRDGFGCVECTVNGDCSGAEPRCKLVDTGESAGDAPVNSCVECIDNDDCTAVGASRCVNNACEPCAVDLDCAHVDGNGATAGIVRVPVCDGGACVQCTGPKREACGDFVCESVARTCSPDRRFRSAALCDDCVSDQECAADARCVAQTFGGTTVGNFCLPQPTGTPPSCNARRPYFELAALSTLDTSEAAPVCILRSTTCPGLNDQTEECEVDSDCGAAGLADGLCAEVGGGNQCTVSCISDNDCTGTGDCLVTGCEL